MRSDEMIQSVRDAAHIGDELAFTDYTNAFILRLINQRYKPALSHELVTATAGYGQQFTVQTLTPGTDLYPAPDRAVAGTMIKVELQLPGQTNWQPPLHRVDSRDQWIYDNGPASVNLPRYFMVQDGFLELYPSPNAAYIMRTTFTMTPSALVTSQSSTAGGDAVVRGLIGAGGINKVARTITVNTPPFDQQISPPAAVTSGNQLIDIIHPDGTYSLSMFSQRQTLAGNVFTILGTDSMDRIREGDFVRVAKQSDWPTGVSEEFHQMWANRAGMVVCQMQSLLAEETDLSNTYAADLEKLRQVTRPQVKSEPKVIPLVPMYARGGRGGNWFGGR